MDDTTLALGGGIALTADRSLGNNTHFPSGPFGAGNDPYDMVEQQMPSKESSRDPRLKRRGSRSASPTARRRSSSSTKQTASDKKDGSRDPRVKRRSRSKSPARRHRRSSSSSSTERRRRRFDDRGGRPRGARRSRSRDRPRSPFGRRRRDRSGSRDRFRDRRSNSRPRRNNWSPMMANKKGPVSPPPPILQQQTGGNVNNPFNPMNQMYNDGYNNYQSNMQYGQQNQQQQQYGSYDYGMQMPPQQQPFSTYPPPVMQPPGDDFQQAPPIWSEPPPPLRVMLPNQAPPIIQPPQPLQQPVESEEDKKKREAAVAREKKTQLSTLRKQREEYKRRSNALTRELKILKEQRTELVVGNEPPSPTTKGFLKENDRLQLQIENKIVTIENVIEMLTGIIGPASSPSPSPPRPPRINPIVPAVAPAAPSISRKKTTNSDDDSSPERLKTKVMESIKRNKVESKIRDAADMRRDVEPYSSGTYDDPKPAAPRVNYVHYDPEMHWCQTCQVFPKTAKDFLTHLHSKDHQQMQKTLESPWHEQPINDEMPSYPDAPTKRTPIRGLQFFVPTTGWYCKICFTWMGDLHCASLHLKSQTHAQQYQEYAAQNPSFEVDWMSDRQRAYETKLESGASDSFSVPSIPRGSVPPVASISDGIPLQIQVKSHVSPAVVIPPTLATPSSVNDTVDEKRQKKKKRKQDDRKEKRKKKRSKKRKHQSSSSSSSSDSSDTDPETSPKSQPDKAKEDASQSIRVAMRNLLKQQNEEQKQMEESGGKWTVVQPATLAAPVPPPPTISANGTEAKKKDDLMISQWNEAPPVIDDKERKLLEQLKGKMKNRSVDRDAAAAAEAKAALQRRDDSREDRRRVSRERSRDMSRGRYDGRGRGRRSRSRGRRSPSRSRSRSTGRYGRRRSRSRSYHRSRVEKPIVRYPEFRPRVPEPEPKKKSRDEDGKSDKKLSINIKKSSASTPAVTKKLPFIGRMPVFKKQTTEEELRRDEQEKNPVEVTTPTQVAYAVPMVSHSHHHHLYHYDGMHQMAPEDYDNLMPDPMQFVSMMGAPPPPPMVPPPQPDKDEPVLPPGIDEADAAQVIKTISDAPLPRKGPLPQDFQDALSIIFPGDRKPEDAAAAAVSAATPADPPGEPAMQTPSIIAEPLSAEEVLQHQQQQQAAELQLQLDEQSQQSMDLYSAFAVVNGVAMLKSDHLAATSYAEDIEITLPVTQVPLPPETNSHNHTEAAAIQAQAEEDESASREAREAELKAARQAELDDLAMLGIDADDLAAQCM